MHTSNSKPASHGSSSRRPRRSGTDIQPDQRSSNGNVQPTSTFTSSLDISVPGMLSQSATPPPKTEQLDTAGAESSANSSKRVPRKSKSDALAAMRLRSTSPSAQRSGHATPSSLSDSDHIFSAREMDGSTPAAGAREFDMTSVKRVSTRHPPPRPVVRPFGIEDCPTFYPTAAEFKDSMKYIQSISDRAKQYGICKVVPPEGWSMPFVTNTQV